jgi:hypothetical protein
MNLTFNSSDFEPIRQIALQFPGAEDSVSHGNTPSIKVNGKFMCRLHENGEFIALRLNFDLRNAYLDSHPEIFHLPDHYRNYPSICMWVHDYDMRLLREVLEASWRGLASKKQILEWEKANNP